jgi:hypothetical protein
VKNSTRRILDLIPAVIMMTNEAGESKKVEIHAIHLDYTTGISIFVISEEGRDHLADTFELPIKVHSVPFGDGKYREGEIAGNRIRIHGTNR